MTRITTVCIVWTIIFCLALSVHCRNEPTKGHMKSKRFYEWLLSKHSKLKPSPSQEIKPKQTHSLNFLSWYLNGRQTMKEAQPRLDYYNYNHRRVNQKYSYMNHMVHLQSPLSHFYYRPSI